MNCNGKKIRHTTTLTVSMCVLCEYCEWHRRRSMVGRWWPVVGRTWLSCHDNNTKQARNVITSATFLELNCPQTRNCLHTSHSQTHSQRYTNTENDWIIFFSVSQRPNFAGQSDRHQTLMPLSCLCHLNPDKVPNRMSCRLSINRI